MSSSFKFNPFTHKLDIVGLGNTVNGITTIDNIGPDGSGNYTIESTNGSITIAPVTNGINLSVTSGTVFVETLTGNTGVATSVANNINVVGTGSITTTGSGATLTASLTGLTNHNVLIGAGNATITNISPSTAGFVLTSNGVAADPSFQAVSASGAITTITGNSGGAESPVAGNFNILGTGSITIVGSANTETVQLTGLTNHSLLVGAGTATITNLGVANNGQLPIGSTGADPVLATLTAGTGISITNGAGSISIAVNGTVVGETITGNSGGALSPTAGNWNILGASTTAGASPVVTSGSGSTLTVNVQKSQAIAATDATKVGLATFDSAAFTVDANGFVSLSSTGDLRTLSDDVGTSITPSGSNIQLVGHVVEQGATKFSTVVAGTNLANINPMSSSRWIVDPLGFNGTHTTISSAITSATSGDTIFILPGTYTENPTLKAGVNLASYECDAFTPNVTIVGKCTMTTAGTVTLTGINLQTNSDFLLAVTGSAASLLNLISCNLNISNNTGISFTSSSPSALITLFNCTGNIGTTGITTFVSTSAGVMVFRNCYISNPGASTTASSTSTGIVAFFNGLIGFPCSTSSTGDITTDHCSWNTGTNIECLATTGTAGAQCQFTEFQSGTASALSIGSGTTVVLSNCNINSSNTNAIAGSGSLTYVGLSFYGSSSQVQNTLTLSLKGSTPSNAASGFIWTSTGTNTSPTWQAASNVGTVTQFDVLVGGASGAIASIGPGSTGQIFQSGGNAANPVYSTATYPSTATTAQQLLVANGTNWVGKALSLNTQVFTSSGTYTPTSGMVYCNIECVGGGGGGGGTANSGATGSCTGGGGGGGAYSRKFASAATIGASQTVTIPASAAGGVAGNNSGASPAATTVGTICTANGGSGGGGNVGGGIGAGGAGGTVGTGDFSVVGEAGGTSIGAAITTVIIPYAGGGASCLGFGGAPLITAGATTGNAGQLYGGGGGGGVSFAAAGTAAGGAGGKGIVIITEYIIA